MCLPTTPPSRLALLGLLAGLSLIALPAAGSSPQAAQTDGEAEWANDLRGQLMQEKNCELAYMTNVREFEFFDGTVANGRAHCLDKRQFDFTWEPKQMKFTIERCGPAVC